VLGVGHNWSDVGKKKEAREEILPKRERAEFKSTEIHYTQFTIKGELNL